MAVIEFEPDGTIRTANDIILGLMGYSLDEIRGEHHSMFVDAHYAKSEDYAEHWRKLQAGEFMQGQYPRRVR